MFPARLLETRRIDEAHVAPVWLTSDDDVWLSELLGELRGCDGQRAEVAGDRIRDRVVPIARRHGVGARVVEAVWTVERRKWKTRVDSPVPPVDVRRTVFELAAERDRAEALATAAAQLGLEVEQIERALFADRARARLLVAPAGALSEVHLREAYNLAVVQTLLARSVEVVATVRSDVGTVVRAAKRLRLMATFEETPEGATRMSITGPLSLFHHTLKYSRAFALWFPSLVATPGWSLEASVIVAGETKTLSLDGSAPLARVDAGARTHDDRLVAALAKALVELGSAWRISRDVEVVRVGRRLFFPDFALECERGRVVVEIAGSWSAEYLASKLEHLREMPVPFVLCVDRESPAPDLGSDPRVVLFDRAVDAAALLARCEQRLGEAASAEG